MIKILGEIGGQEAVESLFDLLNDEDWAIRGAVAEALGNSKEHGVGVQNREPLYQFFQKEDHPFVKEKMESSLRKLEERKQSEN